MKRFLTAACAAAFLFVAAGCDTVDDRGGVDVFTRTVTFSMDDAVFNGDVASVQYEVPDITSGVLEHGAVLCYFREQGTWTAMPYTFATESPDLPAVDYTITIGYGYDHRFLELFYEASTDAVDLDLQPDRTVKVVIIEDYAAGKTGVDLRDYEQVKAYYNLPD